MSGTSFSDIFEPFYEKTEEEQLAERAKAILQSKKEQFGCIIPGDQFTAEEQATINAYHDQKLEGFLRSKDAKDTLETPPPNPPVSFLPQRPLPAYTPGYGPLERAFQDAARKAMAETKSIAKITPVDAMSLFLTRVCLRRYRENYYLFNGAVFDLIPTDELNRVIFHHLHDVIQEIGSASIIKQVADLVKANPDISVYFTTDGPDVHYFANGALDHGILRPVNPALDFFTTFCPSPIQPDRRILPVRYSTTFSKQHSPVTRPALRLCGK